MKNYFFILFLSWASHCSGQFYLGVQYGLSQANLFDLKTGGGINSQTSNETSVTLVYLFARNKKKYDICHGLMTGISNYVRVAQVGNQQYVIDFLDFPVLYTVNIPRTLEGQTFPLFDVVMGFGYHFGVPFSSNYTQDPSATAFMNHGVISNMGLALYTNRGAKLEMAYTTSLDLGTNNRKGNAFTPYKFAAQGFKVALSVPLLKSLFFKNAKSTSKREGSKR
jgi:hypothetical protein